jgi:hypothetical protein
VFMNLHLGHSKTRFSLRSGAGDTRDKFIRVRQREQYGRSIGIRDEGMVLTLDQAGALPDSLSPMVAEDGSVIEKSLFPPRPRVDPNQNSGATSTYVPNEPGLPCVGVLDAGQCTCQARGHHEAW